MKEPLVYIVIVNYNGYRDTIQCLESLENIIYRNYKLVIVDNDSTDCSIDKLSNINNVKVQLLKSDNNLGFAGGNNIAIKYALNNHADYILLLNNDTIVEKDFLNNLLSVFGKDKDIGIVGGKIKYYYDKNKIWFDGGYINWNKFIALHNNIGNEDYNLHSNIREVDFITGCLMLIKRDVIEKVGYLPEEYFMYLEDLDYCVMAKMNGFKLFYNPKAVIYHKVSISSGGENSPFIIKYFTRNRIIFMKKYYFKTSKCKFILINIIFYLKKFIKLIYYLIKLDFERYKAVKTGILEGIAYNKNITK